MDAKLMLTERGIPASYVDRDRVTSLLKMYILEQGSTINVQGYFYRSTCDALLAGMVKDFTYSEEKVKWVTTGLPRFPLGSI